MNSTYKVQLQLRKAVGASQFFTLAFGTIVGVSWIVLLGDWLDQAGPLGAVLAFSSGAVVMVLVGFCYTELATLLPVSGGEAAYAYEIFGLRTAYLVGWTLALINIVVISYMCIASAWILDFLIPGIEGPVLYTFLKGQVHLVSLMVAQGGVLSITYLNYRGVRSATAFQDLLTYGKLAVSTVFFAAGIFCGKVANLHPLFRTSQAGISWRGITAVFVMTLWFYGGFNNVPQLMEEKATGTSLKSAGQVMLLSIGVAAVFYCLVILSASMATPWENLVSKDLPTAMAFREAFHSDALSRAVLLAGLLGTFTAANSCFIAGSRLLFALSRAGIIGPWFAVVHPRYGTPVGAVIFVGIVAACGVLLGRSGVLPIVNVGAFCYALSYCVTCLGVAQLRRTHPDWHRPYKAPGGIFTAHLAALCALSMLAVSLYQPYVNAKGSFPSEWAILFVWAVVGGICWRLADKVRTEMGEAKRRRVILGAASPPPGSANW
jgi:APA family basic amino acid/polyamine antiporter